MKTRAAYAIVFFLAAMVLSGCGGGSPVDSKDAPQPPVGANPQNPIGNTAEFTPNAFLKFVNEQRSLGAGAYEIVVGTAGAVGAGTFTLTIILDDGTRITRNGTWSLATGGGLDSPVHAGNPRFAVDVPHPGGLRVEVDSTVDTVIFLVRGIQVLTRVNGRAGGGIEVLDLLASQINSAEFAVLYYDTVDPVGQRDTLDGFKVANGFGGGGPGAVINATFRDAKDLGYGRDMYAWRRPAGCGIAIFEDNYVVELEPGDATTYGPMNLDAAIERDRRFLEGSNALEFRPLDDADCGNPARYVVTFYTYAPPDIDGVQRRLDEVDFDGRGLKFAPGICVTCHGGTLHPPLDPPALTDVTIKSSTFNVLNPESLEFSTKPGFTFAAQRPNIEAVNALVEEVYDAQDQRVDTLDDVANWSPAFAQEFLATIGPPNTVPAGWMGSEQLYTQVIEPYCLGCHSTRGTKVGEANLANAVNFSSRPKFDAYSDLTRDYVFKRGKMPLSLIGYAKFWEDPNAPKLLADAVGLPDADRVSPGGKPREPGSPVARPGADRVVFIPPGGQRTLELDGSASLFSTSFTWSVVQSPGGHTLANANSRVARLTAIQPGQYRVRLTTAQQRTTGGATTTVTSAPVDIQITFETDMLDDRETVFIASGDQQESISIIALFDDAGCTGCHFKDPDPNSDLIGIPIYFEPGSYALGRERDFFQAVRARINLEDPEGSQLLLKPTSDQPRHGGGIVLRDQPCDPADLTCDEQDYLHYQMLLSWIRAGAPCGGDPDYCDYQRTEVLPPAPTALLTEALPGGKDVQLDWRDNAVNETGFVVQRASDAAFTAGLVEIAVAGPSEFVNATFTDGGLTPLTDYFYRLAAENSVGRSAFTAGVAVTTAEPFPPGAPTLDAATVWSDRETRVAWSAPAGGAGAGDLVGYRVERRSGAGAFADVSGLLAPTQLTFADTGLVANTAYTYRVVAVGLADTRTESAERTATTVLAGGALWGSNCEGCHGVITAPQIAILTGTASGATRYTYTTIHAAIRANVAAMSGLLGYQAGQAPTAAVNETPNARMRSICFAVSAANGNVISDAACNAAPP